MRRLLVLLAPVLLVLLSLAAGALAVSWLLADRAIEQRGSVTEGVVTEVRERLGRDSVVVSLDQLDGRPVRVTRDGPVRVGERLAVEYDPDGPQTGRTSNSGRDRRDGRLLLAGAAAVLVLVAALTPWRRRLPGPPSPDAQPGSVQP